MIDREIGRREFMKITGGAIGASMIAGPAAVFAAAKPGAKVDAMKITTATATMDPVRPEVARVCADAFKQIGWDVKANPIAYNQNVQKVIMDHDYDMWFVMLSGASIRIDPNVFIYQVHHSSQYKKGGYNWYGLNDPAIDKLAVAQQQEMDIEKRREIVFKAQELCHEAQALNVIAYMQMTTVYRSDRIRNVVPMLGEGTGSFWTDINMEVVQGDGYVRTARPTPLKMMNPVAAKDTTEFMELRMIYDPLFRVGPTGDMVPWAAESYKVIDQLTLDLTIRKGMLWHDGKPLTAEDVKFTFDYCKQWQHPFFNQILKRVGSVEITGPHSVRIRIFPRRWMSAIRSTIPMKNPSAAVHSSWITGTGAGNSRCRPSNSTLIRPSVPGSSGSSTAPMMRWPRPSKRVNAIATVTSSNPACCWTCKRCRTLSPKGTLTMDSTTWAFIPAGPR
jgi:peptide/nickel transport system substrate-binding protein